MAKKIKDTQYVFLSTLVRSMENRLLTKEDTDRMLGSRSAEDAARILEERGYTGLAGLDVPELEDKLTADRLAIYAELEKYSPDPDIVRVFRMRYDYHNLKTLLKAEAVGTDGSEYLSVLGRYSPEELKAALLRGENTGIPAEFLKTAAAARQILAESRDPLPADLLLDKACYREMHETAEKTDSRCLIGYVRALTDSANLRTIVRALRQKKEPITLGSLLLEGGSMSPADTVNALMRGESVAEVFSDSAMAAPAVLGAELTDGGSLTEFERQCDNAVTDYLRSENMVSFGEQPLICYLAALDSDVTAIRMILTGLNAGLDAELIRERLRDTL